jgi:hypothetical protein
MDKERSATRMSMIARRESASMTMRRWILSAFTTWLILALTVSASAPSWTPPRYCSLPDVLWEVAKKYDIYFTIETYGFPSAAGSSLGCRLTLESKRGLRALKGGINLVGIEAYNC